MTQALAQSPRRRPAPNASILGLTAAASLCLLVVVATLTADVTRTSPVPRQETLVAGPAWPATEGWVLTAQPAAAPPLPLATPVQPPPQPPRPCASGAATPNSPSNQGALITPPAGAPNLAMLPFQEGHWQGIEVIPNTPALAKGLHLPPDAVGVIIDDVTMPADVAGFVAGDLITAIGQVPTPDIERFIQATDRVRRRRRVEVDVIRHGRPQTIILTAIQGRLGNGNGETAPMIRAGSQPPHRYQGPCTNCHRIGNTGQLPFDQGDTLKTAAPTIRAGQSPPHRPRGACGSCHRVLP